MFTGYTHPVSCADVHVVNGFFATLQLMAAHLVLLFTTTSTYGLPLVRDISAIVSRYTYCC